MSDAMVPLAAAAGFTWMATDELILARTLGIDLHARRPRPRRAARAAVRAVSSSRAGGATVACAFRDHVLSDLIGFTYSGWARRGRRRRLRRAGWSRPGGATRERTGGGEALIPIILDGENAWEHFEGGGRPFLRALYRRLSGHPELRTVTMAEAMRGRAAQELPGDLPRLVDRRELLHLDRPRRRPARLEPAGRRARGARRRRRGRPGSAGRSARGSADRRRQRLVLVVRRRPLVGPRPRVRRPVPPAPAQRLSPAAASRSPTSSSSATSRRVAGAAGSRPSRPRLLAPTLDGEETSYFEWLGAGTLEVARRRRRDAPDRAAAARS